METPVQLAFAIPTKNRPNEIRRLLKSIQRQSVRPSQIVIVDGGTISLRGILNGFPDLNIDYIIRPTSLTEARNLGIRTFLPSVTHAGFLDDDLVLDEGILELLVSFWSKASAEIAGVGLNITNLVLKGRLNFIKRPFLLSNERNGAILPSGYNTWYCPADKMESVEWLFGGASVWRKEIFNEFKFDEAYEGYAFLEDIDFSYRVAQKYKLLVLPEAKVEHLHAPGDRVSGYIFGKMQMLNRYHFVKKHSHLSVLCFFWASIGQILENLIRVIINHDRTFFFKAMGNIAGFYSIAINKNIK